MYMDSINKLRILTRQMNVELDACKEAFICSNTISEERIIISHALLPNGNKLRLLKTVLTSICENNCNYCAFRSGRDFCRISFKPDELANTFMALYRAGIVQGIFISSGIIKGGIYTQDQLIDIAEILRNKMNFRGYIHLKIMPGADYDQIIRTMQLANRVSINIEAPNSQRLIIIAPCKRDFTHLLTPLRWIEEIRQSMDPFLGWEHH